MSPILLAALLASISATALLTDDAYAAAADAAQAHPASMLPMLVVFGLVFYFMLLRPQAKQAKAHQKLVKELAQGDEVVTQGGLLGKVETLHENFVVLNLGSHTITVKKSAIASNMPKGSLESLS